MGFAWQARDFDHSDDDNQKQGHDLGIGDDGLELSIGDRIPNTQKPTTGRKKRKADKNTQKSAPSHKKYKKNDNLIEALPKKKKLVEVVGIDYGTTFSGASYASNVESANNKIETINTWPDDVQFLVKMPSVIAYASENQSWGPDNKKLNEDVIGHNVKPGMISYSWCKILLDEQASPTDFDDPYLYSASGNGTLRLPPGKSAVDVAADFLRMFRKQVMKAVEDARTSEVLDSTPIEFWYTQPAVWDERARAKTQLAIERAGFFERPGDKVMYLNEPEAAAVTAFTQASERSLTCIKTNLLAIVADIGGGTVDVEGMKIKDTLPLKLETLGVGIGGKCGSTTIDRRFIAWCEKVFGQAFVSISELKRGPGSQLMRNFEQVKKEFTGRADDTYRVQFTALAKCLNLCDKTSPFFDFEDGELIIPGSSMIEFFEKTTQDTKRLIRTKNVDIRKIEHREPSVLVLAGGLAQSKYVWKEICDFCSSEFNNSLKPVRPVNAWGAISYGAVVYGLARTTVISRVSRRHYMVVQQRAFREGVDPEGRAVMVPKLGKRLDGELKVLVRKGEAMKENKKRIELGSIVIDDRSADSHRYTYKIICSNNDQPPKWANDPDCFVIGEVAIDLKQLYQYWAKKKGYSAFTTDFSKNPAVSNMNFTVMGGHESGTFVFKACADRQVVGEMIFDYSQEEPS